MLHQACDEAGVPREALSGGRRVVGRAVCPGRRHAGPGLAQYLRRQSQASDLPNDWLVIPLERPLRERSPCAIENDCVSALVAERTFGAVRDEPDCVYVTWSTGIGFGFCVDGHVLHGKHGNAGHAGHMLMSDTSDALCGCGNRGDLEALISGRNLANRLGQSTADVFDAARAGEPAARAIAEDAARWFGAACTTSRWRWTPACSWLAAASGSIMATGCCPWCRRNCKPHACADRWRERGAGRAGEPGCRHRRVCAGDAGGVGEGVAGHGALAVRG